MTEITSLQNLWLITKLKYRGYGSYGNSIIRNLVINKYFNSYIKESSAETLHAAAFVYSYTSPRFYLLKGPDRRDH